MIKERLAGDVVAAQKARDSDRLGVLRMALAALQSREIELRADGKELSDEDALAVMKREAKKRKEAAELYEKGGRADLAAKERQELSLIDAYLPAQASSEAIAHAVDAVVGEGMKEFGPAMKAVMARLGGEADGRIVSELLKKKLGA